MIVIAAVEDRMGMAFRGKRVSRDRILTERILSLTAEKKLWMNAYSAKLFSPETVICVAEDFINKVQAGEYCFIEQTAPSAAVLQIEKVILYRWNRRYPADLYFDLPLSNYQLVQSTEFSGHSHETITEEIYIR